MDCSMEIERVSAMDGISTHQSHELLVRRTQSYDASQSGPNDGSHDGLLDCETDSQSPLHTSFDVSQLSNYGQEQEEGSASTAMEHFPPSDQTTNHSKAAAFTRNYLDLISAASVVSSSSSAKTPVRVRVTKSSSKGSCKSSAKRTPASARRHRLFARRLSPAGRTPSFPRTNTETASASQRFAPPPPLHPQPATEPDQFRQPMDQSPSSPLFEPAATPAYKKSAKRSLGTVATVANSTILETTTETDGSSAEKNDTSNGPASAQTFRFSAFPASLPRITTNAPQKPKVACEGMDASDDPVRSLTQLVAADMQAPASIHCQPIDQPFASLDASVDDLDEMSASPIGTPVGRRRLNFNSVLTPTGRVLPGTPKDVKMHFQGGQCSPIRGIPEEDGDITGSTISVDKHASVLNQSLGSGSTGSSGAGGSRPMPDMGAFEADVSHDNSTDKGGSGCSARSHPASPKLLCPPTPVRTPAWVHAPSEKSSCLTASGGQSFSHHAHHKFGRQNSLIATKVLATCSQRDLEGRTSLENSLLDEDKQIQSSHSLLRHDNSKQHSNSSILTFGESTGVATEPETDHTSSDRDQSSQLAPQDRSEQKLEEDDWLHDNKRDSRLLDEDSAIGVPAVGSEVVSMSTTFEILGVLGRGTFADVYKVRSRKDGKQYAVKKHRRQFRGRRDREITLAEVRHMQRLQKANNNSTRPNYCLYLLFFYQAWQEDGHFFCQTELCCRDTCREFMDALRLNWIQGRSRYPCLRRLPAPLGIAAGSDQDIIGRLVPEATVWKICHDIGAGLSHIHSHGLVHHDIKPSNIFLSAHQHFGAMCKIGDFGMAGDVGTSEDGQEGDQKYMAPELLSSDAKHPSADMFSLGLTMYELASALSFEVPAEGQLWHDLRSARNDMSEIPSSRSQELVHLIRILIQPDQQFRPSADSVLNNAKVQRAGTEKDDFLMAYIRDVEEDEQRAQDIEVKTEDQTPRVLGRPRICVSPSLTIPVAPNLFSSPKQAPSFA